MLALVAATPLPCRGEPPVVPVIDSAMQERLRAVFLAGQAAGNRADVFSKIGDSITATMSFLAAPFGCPEYTLGEHTELQPVINRFSAHLFPPGTTDVWCGVSNSFSRVSLCADSGWTAASALEPIPGPPDGCSGPYSTHLGCELLTARPSVALIMFGTNDLVWDDPWTYRGHMEGIVEGCLAAGVIPVLSTIPPRLDDTAYGDLVPIFNGVIADIARAYQVPLWNFWLALQGPEMVNRGMSGDGIHPNLYGNCAPACDSGNFTREGLRYGFNQRNFTALQVLDKIVRVVMDGADPAPPPPPEPETFSLSVTPLLPVTGGPLAIGVAVPPIGRSFDAWAVAVSPAGEIFSFSPSNQSAAVPGAHPCARDVPGLAGGYTGTLFSIDSLPPFSAGQWTVIAGLVAPGVTPRAENDALPGYADREPILIPSPRRRCMQ
jgi:hypothetical protein